MGEYAKYNGEQIKIGTCEDMYYLRFDQIRFVESVPNSVDLHLQEHVQALRFRFPFPDEDHIQPGGFENAFRSLGIGCEAPGDVDHNSIQFSNDRGLSVSLPCPESNTSRNAPYKIHYNGYAGKVRIIQQRIWDEKLVLVCECGSCGSRYRLNGLEDASPILSALESKAKAEDSFKFGRGEFWRKIAQRIVRGYEMNLPIAV